MPCFKSASGDEGSSTKKIVAFGIFVIQSKVHEFGVATTRPETMLGDTAVAVVRMMISIWLVSILFCQLSEEKYPLFPTNIDPELELARKSHSARS